MDQEAKPIVAVTMGDPCGIGPEVIAKALSTGTLQHQCRPIVIGSAYALMQAAQLIAIPLRIQIIKTVSEARDGRHDVYIIDPNNLKPEDISIGHISPECGRAAMEWVTVAANLAMNNQVQSMATAPVNKKAANLAGYQAIGHMELLQEISGSRNVATMLISGNLRVVHLTTHKSLRTACDLVTRERIHSMIELTHNSFQRWGMANPRIGVAALNPHASDDGLIGDEEALEIGPAILEAQQNGINTYGPIPADIVFHKAIQGSFDVILAMYHDQGHIPIKVHGFEKSVSVNLGLPFVRTSVDHGTAFDIAGKGIADHTSMVETIRLAYSLSSGKGLYSQDEGEDTDTRML